MVFQDKSGDPSPEDNDLKVKSGDLENEWRTYELSKEEIADLKRLQNEFVKSGGILSRGKTYERTSEGESSSLEQKGANLKTPLPDAQYEAKKLRELWEKAQILPTSAFGTPSKLRDLKHISINISPNTTADQTDSILSDYIEARYGDRSNLWGDDKADILRIAKSNGVKIENVSVENGKAEFDISVENLLKLHIAYIGVQEKANITEAAVKDQQWNSAFNQFLVGIGEGT